MNEDDLLKALNAGRQYLSKEETYEAYILDQFDLTKHLEKENDDSIVGDIVANLDNMEINEVTDKIVNLYMAKGNITCAEKESIWRKYIDFFGQV